MNTQDLLYQSSLLDDIFSFLLLAMPWFRFNDVSAKEHQKGIFNFQAERGRWVGLKVVAPQSILVRGVATL